MSARVRNHLSSVRRSRGISAAKLADRAEVARQTIYAIEAGSFVPNTEVALRLAGELEVSVEDLFSLDAVRPPLSESLQAEVLSPKNLAKGQPVRICRMRSGWVGVPVNASPYYLSEADGVVCGEGHLEPRTNLSIVSKDEALQRRLVVAGCDPAMGMLARMVEKICGVEILPAAASSKLALEWLNQGKVHIAGSHLEDPKTGDFNTPFVQRDFSRLSFTIITLAEWEEGLVVATGNPKQIRKIEDLVRKDISFINRETGSGSRMLVERLLRHNGIKPTVVRGYGRVAYGHLAVAYAVASGEADCCVATRSAALAFGLDFTPLRSERYDLVLRRESQELPAVQVFLDSLQRATLRRKLEFLAGYDTTKTGARVL